MASGWAIPARLSRAFRALLTAVVLAAYACALPSYRWSSSDTALETASHLPASESADIAKNEEGEEQSPASDEEEQLERELTAMGFHGADAIIGSKSVCIIVHGSPDSVQAAAIFDAAARISGCEMANIRLIPASGP